MIPFARFESALRTKDPGGALRSLVIELATDGSSKANIYDSLEQFLLHLRQRSDQRKEEEELILDVMDSLTDWCHPSARLLPDSRANTGSL